MTWALAPMDYAGIAINFEAMAYALSSVKKIGA
jgi:hypothetical protein